MINLTGKKIAILGMGVNNRHLADYFTKQNIPFKIFDGWNDPMEIKEQLRGYEIVFRTPGLPYKSELIQALQKDEVEIYSQTKLFFDLCPCPIIGVTGTKGKGTTSSLISAILKTAGKKVWLAGNIGGDPFEFLDQIQESDFVVLELSSFQTQDLHKGPHIAVVLNVTQDHINPNLKMSTHYSQKEYVEAKSQLLKFQTETDFAVLHPALPDWFKDLGMAKKVFINPDSVADFKTQLLGKHNLENISAAVESARFLNIDDKTIRAAVSEFKPYPHRLQYFKGSDELVYVDDSASTNEESSIAAIRAITQPMVLVLGGSDKGFDYKTLAEEIFNTDRIKGIVVMGDVADRIKGALSAYSGKIVDGGSNMKSIVAAARSLASPGDAIVLSPAAASFGLFKNYNERGDLFQKEATSK